MSDAIRDTDTGTGSKPDKRSAILDAAATQFLTYGFRRTNVGDIADEAKLAKGTIYLHFQSKEDLFDALARHLMDRFLVTGRTALHGEGPPARRLTGYLDAVIGEPGRLLAASPHAAELMESKQAHIAEQLRRYDLTIQRDVRMVLNAAGLPESAADLVIAAAHGQKKLSRDPQAYRRQLDLHLFFLLEGLTRRPRP